MSMSSSTVARPSLLLGLLVLGVLPVAVLLDTFFAVRRGWAIESAGALALVPALAVVGLAVLLLALLFSWTRKLIARRWPALLSMVGGVVVGVVASELLLAAVLPQPSFHRRVAGAQYTFEPNPMVLPGCWDEKRHRINELGLRGTAPTDDAELRVLCVGGSTTECVYVDDSETWPALVEAQLNEGGTTTTVAAAGYAEYAVPEHTMFVEDAAIVDDFNCLIVMCGAGDFVRHVLKLGRAAVAPYWLRSKLISTLRGVWNGTLGNGYYYDREGETLELRRRGRPIEPRDLDWEVAIESYAERLEALIAAANRRDVRLVLLTQPVLWDPFLTDMGLQRLWLTRVRPYPREWDFLNPADVRAAFDRYNGTLLEVADRSDVEVVDVTTDLSGWEAFFYDDFHLNVMGCEKVAAQVAEYLASHPASPSEAAGD